jgi:TonB family protein
MTEQGLIRGRRSRPQRRHEPLERLAAGPALAGAVAYPGYADPDDGARTRAFLTGSAILHAAGFAVIVLLASLAPVIEEHVIPVQLLAEEPQEEPQELPPPPPPEELAAAPKALAQRRDLPFAPSVQAVTPQIVNPRIIAEARPAVAAEALQMDALSSTAAPTEIRAQTTVVERVSVLNSVVRAHAANVDVSSAAGPVVRGPIVAPGPVGPSVGPRRVEAAAVGNTIGTGLQIGSGNGSSVRDGVVSNRDVVGSPSGAVVVSVDTSIGEGLLANDTAGTSGDAVRANPACLQRPAVMSYLAEVKSRMFDRWVLPPGVDAGRTVTLRFHIDVAGSASKVAIVSAEDNALGASAVDALRAAAPFPPMPEEVRCLADQRLVGTFRNPVGG